MLFNNGDELYNYCLQNKLGTGVTSSFAGKHFQLILDNLLADEEILVPFMGLHNYASSSKHDGAYAYALTNKRIIMAQKKIIGQDVVAINLDYVNNINMSKHMLRGYVTFETLNGIFNVATITNEAVPIYNFLQNAFNDLRLGLSNTDAAGKITNENDKFTEIEKYKKLLDDEIITQDEFDKKKKELLVL